MTVCIGCANGNDLSEGDECVMCQRVGKMIHDPHETHFQEGFRLARALYPDSEEVIAYLAGWLSAPAPDSPSPVSEEEIAVAIRQYCNRQSRAAVQRSDGEDRIYYAGLSVSGLARAILALIEGRR